MNELHFNGFVEWATQNYNIKETSVNNYISWLRNVSNRLFIDKYAQFLWKVYPDFLQNDINKALETLEILNDYIEDVYESFDEVPKIIKDYRSAFRKYKEFITTTYISTDTIEDTILVKKEYSSFEKELDRKEALFFSYEDFCKTIISRLRTQDRTTGKVYFPIRLLGSILSNSDKTKNYWKEWQEASAKQIIVYTYLGEEKLLSDFTDFIISKESGAFGGKTKNGEYIEFYTKTKFGELRPFRVSSKSEISIEHSIPMKKLLENISAIPTLVKITEICKSVTDITDGNELKQMVWREKETELLLFAEGVKKDMEYLRNATKLELMERRENRYF